MAIFTSKKVWKFSIKINLTKSDPKKGQVVESTLCSSEFKNLPLSCKTLYLESDVILTVPAVKTLDTPDFHNKVWLPKSRTTQVNNMFEPDTAT